MKADVCRVHHVKQCQVQRCFFGQTIYPEFNSSALFGFVLQDSLQQRRGRAGRVQKGLCFRLLPRGLACTWYRSGRARICVWVVSEVSVGQVLVCPEGSSVHAYPCIAVTERCQSVPNSMAQFFYLLLSECWSPQMS